ncbi:uncharacterized protein [Atheta coriaria]|uniref:uncharacterized protein isoform X2 n=1 Tax=Dalotia coriaria TaxID=877792 RepID=UPI0031F42B27
MTTKSPRKSNFPGSLTDLHRFRRTAHGHDGSSRIVMVRKTDQRTFASIQNGKEPMLETVTRETIETFRGQRTACKITTEKKNREETVPPDLVETLAEKADRSRRGTPVKTSKNLQAKTLEQFQTECLQDHNMYRRRHGVTPLKLNKQMCKSCLDHATFLLKKNNLQHSSNKKYGENIYFISSPSLNPNTDIKGSEPVDMWYREVKKHDFTKEPTLLSTGHFTQVVWKESQELGVAFVAAKGKLVVVAQYYPPGNIIGSFVENVPPLVTNINNNNCISTLNISKTAKSSFNAAILDAHNKYRMLHGARPLELDANLCRFSEEWAKMCAERGIMEHRKNNPYGENIFCIHNADPNFVISGNMPVDSWYEEHQAHPFGREPSNLSTGHFSQVVWKTSEKLGVGVATRNGYTYIVANYSPAGNFVGHFAESVLPAGSLATPDQERVSFGDEIGFDQFQLEALKYHNEYRKKHNAPPLTLNKQLSIFALEWAQHCAFHGMSHRPKNEYGENTYMVYSSDFSFTPCAKDVVSTWYAQKRHHIFGLECVNMNTLHFTQLVWKETSEMGIALAKNSKGETYVVANYNPRGNVVGHFNENVLKAKVV